jgi:hypothetical protein
VEAFHLALEVVRCQVTVKFGRHARVLVPHDPLDGGQVRSVHEQQ